MRKRILNQPIDVISLNEALYLSKMALANPRQFKIITLNPEMVINAMSNLEFQAAMNNANLIVPDGIGTVWALKLSGIEDAIRIPGIELSEKILDYCNELGKKVAFFGSSKEILEKLIRIFNQKYTNIEIVKAIDGFQGEEKDFDIAEEIAGEDPNVVFVALGTPRQEIWINKHSNLFPRSIMIGVGGSLDVWSGNKSRAPEFIRNLNLEWLYRVLLEPKRFARLLSTLPKFVFLVLKDKLKNQETETI